MNKLSHWILTAALALGVPQVFAAEQSEAIQAARKALDDAARVLAELYKGSVDVGEKKAMLGILLHDSGNRSGIQLAGVTPGAGAAEAGLRAGDVLIGIGDQSLVDGPVAPLKVIGEVMHGVEPGEKVQVQFLRGDETRSVEVETFAPRMNMTRILEGSHGAHNVIELSDLGSGVIGLMPDFVDMEPTLAAYFGVDEGVLVVKSGESAGLRAGDVLVEVNGVKVKSALDAYQVLGKHDHSVDAKVIRERDEVEVEVDGSSYMALDVSSLNKNIQIIHKEVHDDGDVRVEITVDDQP